jgi:hypothetical protein
VGTPAGWLLGSVESLPPLPPPQAAKAARDHRHINFASRADRAGFPACIEHSPNKRVNQLWCQPEHDCLKSRALVNPDFGG